MRFIDVGGYRHNYEQGEELCENYLLSSLYLMVKSFEEEIQPSGDRV